MLSVGKLTAGAEDYYLRTVASGREDYYTGAGEAPGVWLGHGARELGLVGTVDAAQLHAVLGGRDPWTGADLTTGRVDRSARVAGFDCTFSAPKSVSVLWGLSDPATTGGAVRDAHDRAVEEALGYLQAHAFVARRGTGGEQRIATTGMVAAAFRHRTSRAGDPQLHTHVLVANVCQGTDGRWSAPDARLLYFHARAAGFLYQAALRAHLTESLGLTFGPVHRGVAEVAGVPDGLLRAFSTRRQEIEAALERHGGHSARAAEVAALDTRRRKDGPAGDDRFLRDRWWARAKELGVDPAVLQQVMGRPRQVADGLEAGESLFADLLSPIGLTAHEAAFERRDVVRALAERFADGAHVAEVEQLVDEVLRAPDVVGLAGDGRGGEGRHTTTELLATENRLLMTADRRKTAGVAVVPEDRLQMVLADQDHLADEQRRMVEHLATSGQGVDVVVGKAGAGKTTALAAARAAFEAAGYRVTGTALSARAAAGLEEGAGIPSTTLARLLHVGDPSSQPFGPRHVLVVDEAGMVGTRDLARLLERAAGAEAKVVLVGDHRQLPEIATGGAFGGLVERLGAVSLETNRRQEEAWERTSLDELRHGHVGQALAAYDHHRRVHRAPTMADARRALVADWLTERGQHRQVRMLATTRSNVEALNALAREELRARGHLGSVVAEAGGRTYALGDEVVCLRNDRRLGVMNGTRATVVAGSLSGGITVLTDDRLRHLSVEYLDAGHLAHGYATTIHKSQGETVDRAFVLGSEALYREAGYVALSRARTRTDLYVPTGSFEDGTDESHPRQFDLTRSLATSRAKRLAADDVVSGSGALLDEDPVIARIRRTLAQPEGRERTFRARDLGLGR